MGLLWKDGDSRFKVESVAFKNRPNVVTFQVVTGNCWYYVVGVLFHPIVTLGWMKFGRRWKRVIQDAHQ